MKKNKKGFIRSFLSLGVGSIIYLIIGLIGTPIITHIVDPIDYGSMSMLIVYSNIGLMVFGLGLDQALLRFFYRDDDIEYKKRLLIECFAMPIIFTVCLGALITLGALCGNNLILSIISLEDIILLEISIIALLLHRYSILIVRLRYHTDLYSVINIIQKLLYIVLTIIGAMVIKSNYYEILAIATIISTIVASLVGIICEKELWDFRKCKKGIPFNKKILLKYSIPIMFSSGVTMVFNALDKISLDYYCSRGDVGVYSSAMNLIAIFAIVRTSFNALWMPSAVEHYEKDNNDVSFFQKGNYCITMLMFFLGMCLILFKDIIVWMLGEKYREASFIIPFLMFEPILYTISETTATGMVVKKKSNYQVIVALVACLVNFIGNIILTPRLGPRGAAISTAVAYIVFFAVRTMLSNRAFYIDYKLTKIYTLIFIMSLYAAYSSFNSFDLMYLLFFIIGIMLMIFMYIKELKVVINVVYQNIRNRLKR